MKKIYAEGGADGEHDITESVQVLYDLAHSSMDWGSGMLDTDEMRVVIQLAVTMGWKVPSLDNNSSRAMQEIASEFPDHYEVIEEPNPYYGGDS